MKRGPVAIRFPYFTPLLDVIDSKHMARGLPPEWWLEVEVCPSAFADLARILTLILIVLLIPPALIIRLGHIYGI